VATLSSISLSAKLALTAGALATAFAWRWPRATGRGLLLAATLVPLATALVMPLLPDPQALWAMELPLPPSAHHRLTIWRFATERIAEHPLIGWGTDESRRIAGGDTTLLFTRMLPGEVLQTIPEPVMPLHPHNGLLQAWLELGLVGLGLILAVLAVLFARVQAIADRPARAGLLAACAAALTVYSVSYGAWQSWWLSGLWLIAAASWAIVPRRAP
jgi:exopolysaccharide production protein ExoQ